MNEIKLINKIFSNNILRDKIILFYDKRRKPSSYTTRDSFLKFCKENFIDIEPSILFYFFDENGIKISIMPSRDGFWSNRIYLGDSILVSNDYIGRKEATFGALLKSIEIFTNNNNQ